MEPITLITGNLGKVEEASRYLGLPLEHIKLDLPEIQSLDSEAIVRDKAERAYGEVGKPVLVEDVSFVLSAMSPLPGPLMKWFEEALGNEGICRLVDGKDRGATATVTYGYHDGRGVHIFQGEMYGSVPEHPAGDRSFGWAPIFVPLGMDRTYAELSDEEQEGIAMRKKALSLLREHLSR